MEGRCRRTSPHQRIANCDPAAARRTAWSTSRTPRRRARRCSCGWTGSTPASSTTCSRNVHKQHRLPTVQRGRRAEGRADAVGRRTGSRSCATRVRRLRVGLLGQDRPQAARWRARHPEGSACRRGPRHCVSFEQFLDGRRAAGPGRGDGPALAAPAPQPAAPAGHLRPRRAAETSTPTSARSARRPACPEVPFEVRNPSKQQGADSVYDGRPDLVRRVETDLRRGHRALRLLSGRAADRPVGEVAHPVDRHLGQRRTSDLRLPLSTISEKSRRRLKMIVS